MKWKPQPQDINNSAQIPRFPFNTPQEGRPMVASPSNFSFLSKTNTPKKVAIRSPHVSTIRQPPPPPIFGVIYLCLLSMALLEDYGQLPAEGFDLVLASLGSIAPIWFSFFNCRRLRFRVVSLGGFACGPTTIF